MIRTRAIAIVAAVGIAATGCADKPPTVSLRDAAEIRKGVEYRPPIRPSDFVSRIDNPYHPLLPGTVRRYETTVDGEREVNLVEVTNETKTIMGVETTVVRDRVYANGEIKEDTFDWFAQDRFGNVWYFGEDTKEFENGKVKTTAGSWTGGVDGQPGIIMPGSPKIGVAYHQEYSPGNAVDNGKVISRDGSVKVPFGSFRNVIVTEEWSDLEKGVLDRKYYARGIGTVLERRIRGGREVSRLVDVKPRPDAR